MRAALDGRSAVADDLEVRREGARIALEVRTAPILDDGGQVLRAVGIFQDITERKTLERAFAQAQKMQAVGLLAGGIAHDFNNSLTAVYGYADWLQNELPPGNSLHEPVLQIRKAADRVLNLVINARDAMPEGGRLVIETDATTLDEEHVREHVGAKTGRHVMLAVTDTGVGMDAATQARVFEPFFTTKGSSGTGLGLSTVYGIVKQSGGNVWVYSELGRGTEFKVYLPVTFEAPMVPQNAMSAAVSGAERILVVEDDPAIRQLCTSMLRKRGYTVDEVADGETAVAFAESADFRIDLLLTDVVLPGLNGRRVAERVTEIHPAAKVLYISGYTENAIVHTGVLDPMVAFLPKPFTPTQLVERVRQVLDACVT